MQKNRPQSACGAVVGPVEWPSHDFAFSFDQRHWAGVVEHHLSSIQADFFAFRRTLLLAIKAATAGCNRDGHVHARNISICYDSQKKLLANLSI